MGLLVQTHPPAIASDNMQLTTSPNGKPRKGNRGALHRMTVRPLTHPTGPGPDPARVEKARASRRSKDHPRSQQEKFRAGQAAKK